MQVFIERAQRLHQAPYLVHLYLYGVVYLKLKYLDELMRPSSSAQVVQNAEEVRSSPFLPIRVLSVTQFHDAWNRIPKDFFTSFMKFTQSPRPPSP